MVIETTPVASPVSSIPNAATIRTSSPRARGARSGTWSSEQTMVPGGLDSGVAIANAELAVDGATVCRHRVDGHVELLGDVALVKPAGEVAQQASCHSRATVVPLRAAKQGFSRARTVKTGEGRNRR